MTTRAPKWAFVWRMLALTIGISATMATAGVGVAHMRDVADWTTVFQILIIMFPAAISYTLAVEYLRQKYNGD